MSKPRLNSNGFSYTPRKERTSAGTTKDKVGVCVIMPDGASKEDRDAISDILKELNDMYDIKDYDEVATKEEFIDKVASVQGRSYRRENDDWMERATARVVRKWKKRR